ncbi:MAG: KEOPS complex kinase/ATPase Bud32 [archaeon]
MKEIARGAEAVIRLGEHIVKERVTKGYRVEEIDSTLRKSRTRREAKVLERLAPTGFVPKLIKSDDKAMTIEMEEITGERLAVCLEKQDIKKICTEIGQKVAEMHNQGIIHGDLTTSNMILHNGKVFFIDFGLSFFSTRIEDLAVDLHVLKEALEAKHHTIWEDAFKAALKGYKKHVKEPETVISKLETVEGRGRYKGKGS